MKGIFKSLFAQKKPLPQNNARLVLSDTEQFLLSLFLKPRLRSSIIGPGWGDLWASRLGKRPEVVLRDFQQNDLLQLPDIGGLLAVKFRVPELVNLCKENGVNAKGKKDELVARLIENVSGHTLQSLVATVDALQCTERGRSIGEAYKTALDGYRLQTEEAVLDALKARRLHDACQIVINFESRQPLPRGIGVDWARADYSRELGMLEGIFEQPVVNEEQSLAAAQSMLWGVSADRFLPRIEPRRRKTPEEKAAELSARKEALRAMQHQSLESYKANRDVVLGVSIFAAGSSCDHCKAMEGDYSFEDVPILPHEGCTHEMGCRCCYAPLTEFSERVSKN